MLGYAPLNPTYVTIDYFYDPSSSWQKSLSGFIKLFSQAIKDCAPFIAMT
jgi:hypothetical protein